MRILPSVLSALCILIWICVLLIYPKDSNLETMKEWQKQQSYNGSISPPITRLFNDYCTTNTDSSEAIKKLLVNYVLSHPVTVVTSRRKEIMMLELYRERVIAPARQALRPIVDFANTAELNHFQNLSDISTFIRALYLKTLPGRAYEQNVLDGKIDFETISDDEIKSVILLLDAAALMERYSAEWDFGSVNDTSLVQMDNLLRASAPPLKDHPSARLIKGNYYVFKFAQQYVLKHFYADSCDAEIRLRNLDDAHMVWSPALKRVIEDGDYFEPNLERPDPWLNCADRSDTLIVFPDRYIPSNRISTPKEDTDKTRLAIHLLAYVNNELEIFNWRFLPVPVNCPELFDQALKSQYNSIDRFEYALRLIYSAGEFQKEANISDNELLARVHTTIAETYCTMMRFKEKNLIDLTKYQFYDDGNGSTKLDGDEINERVSGEIRTVLKLTEKFPPDLINAHDSYLSNSQFLSPYWAGSELDQRKLHIEMLRDTLD